MSTTGSVTAGQTYYLINKQANNAMDLSAGDNTSVIGYGLHDGDNQKWRLANSGSGWTLQNASTGSWLTVDGPTSSAVDGTRVVAGSTQTIWDIWPDEDDPTVHRLFIPNTRLNIDLSDYGNTTPGTPVQVWGKWSPGTNQCWLFEPA